GLTLTNALARFAIGGAILDDGAPLALKSDTLSNDQAIALGAGGGLGVLGESTAGMTVTVTNCKFVNDAVTGSPGDVIGAFNFPGGDARGGAIYVDAESSAGLVLTVSGTSFTSDSTTGGPGVDGVAASASYGGGGGAALGAAVFINADFAANP